MLRTAKREPHEPELYRHKAGDEENAFLKLIRDNELEKNAPFSGRKLLVMDDARTLAEFPETASVGRPVEYVIEDVPIMKIVGVSGTGHLDNFKYGMEFQDVLFESLHGVSLTQESLDYFLSDTLKGDEHRNESGYTEMPQDMTCEGSARARRGITLMRRGDVYFADHGKQRTLMAMFWIYQNQGKSGMLRKVSVGRPI